MTRHYSLWRGKTLFLVCVITLFLGVGCSSWGNIRNPLDRPNTESTVTRSGVVLTQGAPPEDCGERNPDRLFPYFTIPDPHVVAGEPMYMDATCSVGRITEVRWTFDFEAWPDDVPGEQRFEPAIAVSDTQNGLNNTSPFLQTYTPSTPGTHTARLLAKDHRGIEHMVIHTYVVSPRTDIARQYSSEYSLEPHFVFHHPETIVPSQSIDNARGVFIPYHVQDSEPVFIPSSLAATPGQITALPFGSTGNIGRHEWELVERHEPGGVRERIEGTTLPVPSYTFTSAQFRNAGRRTREKGFLGSTRLSANFGQIGRIIDDPAEFVQVEVSGHVTLTLDDLTVEPRQLRSFTRPISIVDQTTVPALIAQMSMMPISASADGLFTSIEWPKDRSVITLEPEQPFELQNYSIPATTMVVPRGPDTVGQKWGAIAVEFDFGDGQFREVLSIQEAWRLDINIEDTLVRERYRAPSTPGDYTARMRIRQAAVAGFRDAQEAVVDIPYRVVPPEPFSVRMRAYPDAAQAGQQVVFDASPSTGNVAQFVWEIIDPRTGTRLYESPRTTKLSPLPPELSHAPSEEKQQYYSNLPWPDTDKFTWKFTDAGRYIVRVTTFAKRNARPEFTELEYIVHDPQSRSLGNLPRTMQLVIYPDTPLGELSIVDQPIAQGQPIAFFLKDTDINVGLVEYDFDGDGVYDDRCYASSGGGFVIPPDIDQSRPCSPRVWTPSTETTGTFTARARVSEYNNGPGQTILQKTYTIQNEQGRVFDPNRGQVFPDISVEVFPAGVVRGGGIGDSPIYENDRIVIRVNGLTLAVGRVTFDFEGDGTVDNDCTVEEFGGGYLGCSQVTKDPPHTFPSVEPAAIVTLYEKRGTRAEEKRAPYTYIDSPRIKRNPVTGAILGQ